MLVVDDDDGIIEMLRRALVHARYQVVAATTVARARAAIDTHVFDAVVTDLRLGDGSGLDVFAAARARAPSLPVVFLGGDLDAEPGIGGLPPPIWCLAKPTGVTQLVAVLKTAVR